MNIKDAYKLIDKYAKAGNVTAKGTPGEVIILELCKKFLASNKGYLLHSYKHPYMCNPQGEVYLGNIKQANGVPYNVSSPSFTDEIDVTLITEHRVFIIEVKARQGTWKIDDIWMRQSGKPLDESLLAQTEKHAQHIYHMIYEYLPDGDPDYIVPVLVFVDKATIKDERSLENKVYLPVAIANTFRSTLLTRNMPGEYKLDIEKIYQQFLNNGKAEAVYK